MNREDVIRMAREAGVLEPIDLLKSNQWQQDAIRELERFAALVAAVVREECACVCDSEAGIHERLDRNGRSRHLDDAAIAKTCAAAIRAMGKV